MCFMGIKLYRCRQLTYLLLVKKLIEKNLKSISGYCRCRYIKKLCCLYVLQPIFNRPIYNMNKQKIFLGRMLCLSMLVLIVGQCAFLRLVNKIQFKASKKPGLGHFWQSGGNIISRLLHLPIRYRLRPLRRFFRGDLILKG